MLVAMGACAPVAWGQDWDDWDDYESYVPERKGIEFALNFGVYQGHPKRPMSFTAASQVRYTNCRIPQPI